MADKRPAVNPGRERRKRPQAPCAHSGLVPVIPDGEVLEGVVCIVKTIDAEGDYSYRTWRSPGFGEHEAAWWLNAYAEQIMAKWDNFREGMISNAVAPDVED